MPRGAGFLLTDFSSGGVLGSSMLQFTDGPPRGTKSDPIECTRESACGDFAVHAVYTISDWNYPCSPVSSQSILNQRF